MGIILKLQVPGPESRPTESESLYVRAQETEFLYKFSRFIFVHENSNFGPK